MALEMAIVVDRGLRSGWTVETHSVTTRARVHSMSGRVQEITETLKTTKNHFFGLRSLGHDWWAECCDSSTATTATSAPFRPILQQRRGTEKQTADGAQHQ